MVYLVYDKRTKLTKIGRTSNIKARMNNLKCANPFIVLVYFTDKISEKELHEKYFSKRVKLEWFDLSLSDYIEIIGKKYGLPKSIYYKKNIKEIEKITYPIISIKSEKTVIRYTFEPYFCGYFQEGKWHDNNGKQLKEKYYNGRVCIDYNKKRYGINKLRKYAKRNEINIDILPF